MTARELRDILENADLSEQAYAIVEGTLDNIGSDVDEYDLNDEILNEIDSQFIYYDDAWEYLQDQCITDFSEAIHEYGAEDIMSIASYYLMREIEENFLSEVY